MAIFTGGPGDDILVGGVGDDELDGGAGADTMVGGLGADTYFVDDFSDGVLEFAGEGIDTVVSSIDYSLGADIENLTLAAGSAAVSGTGNDLNNVIVGNDNNNFLGGGAGVDALVGGLGNDTYVVDNVADTVVEAANEGQDDVFSNVSFALSDHVETLTLTGIDAINGTGNSLDNTLMGNDAANVLTGGVGDDTYVVSTGDTVVEAANEGFDTVLSYVSWTLGAHVEKLMLFGTGAINGTGNSLDNTLIGLGNDAANVLTGGAGDDTYVVSTGDTVVEAANEGFDTVRSYVSWTLGAHVEKLTLMAGAIAGTGNELNNTLTGNSAANILTGGLGDDVLDGGAGADRLDGGFGNDTYFVDNFNDVVIDFFFGQDTVVSSIDYVLGADIEDLTLAAGSAAVAGTGNALNNGIRGNDNANVLNGGAGFDTLAGGFGDDTYFVDNFNDVVIDFAGAGIDTVVSTSNYVLDAGVEDLTLAAGSAAVVGTGNALNNVIRGNDNSNVLDGKLGVDTLVGGLGNDTYRADTFLDVVIESAGEGHDSVLSTSDYVLGANVEDLTLTAGSAAVVGTGNALNNQIFGNGIDNLLDGGAGDDSLLGGDGNDILEGGTGDDSLRGGAGEGDLLKGGLGNDSYIFGIGDGLDIIEDTVVAGEGNRILFTAGIGQSDLTFTYFDVARALTIQVGSSGTDRLTLSNFDPTGANGSLVVEFLDFADGSRVSLASLLATEGDDVITTGADNDVVDALGGNDVVNTGSGNDTIIGGLGNDQLTGGVGSDSMSGGAGNDLYSVDDVGDVVIEAANEGTDTVSSTVSYVLSANVENLTLTGNNAIDGTGNSLDNTLTGNSAANVLDGGLGADTLVGGAGSDIYFVSTGDTVVEAATEGVDVVFSDVSWTLGANLEILTLYGTGAVNGTGNSLNNTLVGNSAANVLTGGAGDDTYGVGAGDMVVEAFNEGTDLLVSTISWTLGANVEGLFLSGTDAINGTGNSLDNTLTGNSAANVLTGGAGADVLNGGAGNDTYVVGTGDTVRENANEGTDTVLSDVSWTLGANLEKLTLYGTGAVNGTGNSLNNTLTGNSAANVLTGGLGDDIYYAGVGDTMVEQVNAGTDLVYSTLSWTLGANLEKLTLYGTGAVNGTGNSLNNTLTGNSAANVLTGGLGDDIYYAGVGDTMVEAVNAGTDLVYSTLSWTLGANLEKLTLFGTGAVNGIGNSLNNTLTGNSAANVLTGGTGNDTYVVGTGDTVVEQLAEGTDTVQSALTYTLGANLENLTLTGALAITGTGNSLNNTLIGNSAANVLAGGLGDDTYNVGAGDTVVENVGEGTTDKVQSDVTWTLGANIERLTLTGTGAINGTGNSLNNTLTGNSAANVLTGGTGNDTYYAGVGDTMVEAINEGTDLVYSTISWTLGANLEKLTLFGTGAVNGIGNSLNNTLTGNSAANGLTGGAGNDTLAGGLGNDTYRVDRGAGQDRISENDGTVGNSDSLLYGATINPLDLVLSRQVNDLRIAIHGSTDQVTVQNWYSAPTTAQVETIHAGNGQTLLSTQVDQLIQAMATFSANNGGITWDQAINQQSQQVQTVLAASWQ
jgi:Ca2+-binding RTX toxin-like protein